MRVRKLVLAAACLGLAPSASADTIREITTHGMVVTIAGADIDLAFTSDGKFTGLGGQMTGEWRIYGEKLCTKNNLEPTELCDVYPKDKKSGDSFELVTPRGTAMVRIK